MSGSESKPRKKRRGKAPEGAAAEPPVPSGPDRILEFADRVQASAEVDEEEERQQLETWVSCRLEDELYGLPVRQVSEILRVAGITRVPHAPFPVRGVTNMRGHVLPVVDLRRRLQMEEAEEHPKQRIVVVSSRGRLIGLLVDRVEKVLRIDRLKVEPPPADVMTPQSAYIEGIYRLEEEILVLLDADRVLQIHDEAEARAES